MKVTVKVPISPAQQVFERLATETWEKLRDGHDLGISQGECTITDHNLLEICRARLPSLQIVKTPSRDEARTGTDWEWWIGCGSKGWYRFAIQAKKLYPPHQTYVSLGHKVGKRRQVDVLGDYARANRAIPLYCLYNYVPCIDQAKYWHCCQRRVDEQFGCTLAHLNTIRIAVNTRGARSFGFVHSVPTTMPWRCIFCNSMRLILNGVTDDFADALDRYPALPECILGAMEGEEQVEFDPQYYSPQAEALPARIMVIATD